MIGQAARSAAAPLVASLVATGLVHETMAAPVIEGLVFVATMVGVIYIRKQRAAKKPATE